MSSIVAKNAGGESTTPQLGTFCSRHYYSLDELGQTSRWNSLAASGGVLFASKIYAVASPGSRPSQAPEAMSDNKFANTQTTLGSIFPLFFEQWNNQCISSYQKLSLKSRILVTQIMILEGH